MSTSLIPTPCAVRTPTISGAMNPERLQETFAMPIKIPEYFGANSIKFVDGPDVLKFAKVIAMVIIAIAEVAVDA